MQSLAKHDHQMIVLNDDWMFDRVEFDMEAQRLSLALEFIGAKVTCPDCSSLCARKDKAPERTIEASDQVLNTLSESQKGQIQGVSMDMWQAFKISVKSICLKPKSYTIDATFRSTLKRLWIRFAARDTNS